MVDPVLVLPFVVVVALVGVFAFVLRGAGGNKAAASRLDVLVGKRRTESSQDILLKNEAFGADKNRLVEAVLALIPNLQKIFEQADANIKPSTLALFGVGLGLVGVMGSVFAGVPYFFWPVSFSVLFLVPFGWLWNKRRVRLNNFAAQLPDAMELIARALRAGHSLAAGMHVVAEEMPPPIADEFSRVYEEQNLGISLEDALTGMCDRVPNLDLRFFITSVIIQRQTGGDLAEILDKIGYVIRERYKIMGQVKALTAEGRLSGVVLIALPFVLFLVMLHLKYDYVALLWQKPLGIKMLVIAGFMQLLGAFAIKKIIDIKV
jgi:tight adherence protein B